ncbi:MAG: T9SS type A sorting domain-containing protein [Tannerella sp.]|nr:T9SS type A sorting domain-containing protein [Tannerella sp.]
MVITKSITPCFIHINGPSVICGFYNDYEIPNLPAGISGSQITWSSNTPIISIVGSNIGAGVTIRANGALGGIGVLSANVNGTQISKTISILGTSFGNNIEGPSTMPIDSYQDYSLNQFTSVIFGPDDPFCGCFYYQWTCSPNLTIEYEGPSIEPDFVSQSSGDPEPEYPDEEELGWSLNAQVHAVGCGSGWIRLAVHVNGDSTIYNKSVDVTCSGQQSSSRSSGVGTFSVAVSPNPVDDRLTVNIQPVVVGQAKQKTSYDVLLRNFGGTVVRRLKTSTSFDLDVSDLPGGVYFLSVSDDIGSQPIVKQILIK